MIPNAAPRLATIQLLVVLLCLVWGSTWVVIQEGLEDLPPLTSAGARFALAFVALCALAPLLHRWEKGDAPPPGVWIPVGTLNFGISYAVVYLTETVLPSGLVCVLWAVFPLMMGFAGHWLLDEKLRARQWIGLLIGFLGVALLFVTDLDAFGPEAIPMALFLFVSPAVSVAGQVVLKRRAKQMSSVLINRNAMGFGALLLCTSALLFERDAATEWTPAAIGSIVYLALFGTVMAFTLYFWLLRHASATGLSTITFLTPAVALLLGWALRDEAITMTSIAGSALILVGVALAILRRR